MFNHAAMGLRRLFSVELHEVPFVRRVLLILEEYIVSFYMGVSDVGPK
jgi:hypothetical protein